ncbi:hypothetical protein [Parashewanella tropica]|uniref:hypothetical protein n=1 Tax=Parashewanella tropica TaxID=2547970 RepID=UPI001059355A|nr:hypothetical protein [Parashewanella tropica]
MLELKLVDANCQEKLANDQGIRYAGKQRNPGVMRAADRQKVTNAEGYQLIPFEHQNSLGFGREYCFAITPEGEILSGRVTGFLKNKKLTHQISLGDASLKNCTEQKLLHSVLLAGRLPVEVVAKTVLKHPVNGARILHEIRRVNPERFEAIVQQVQVIESQQQREQQPVPAATQAVDLEQPQLPPETQEPVAAAAPVQGQSDSEEEIEVSPRVQGEAVALDAQAPLFDDALEVTLASTLKLISFSTYVDYLKAITPQAPKQVVEELLKCTAPELNDAVDHFSQSRTQQRATRAAPVPNEPVIDTVISECNDEQLIQLFRNGCQFYPVASNGYGALDLFDGFDTLPIYQESTAVKLVFNHISTERFVAIFNRLPNYEKPVLINLLSKQELDAVLAHAPNLFSGLSVTDRRVMRSVMETGQVNIHAAEDVTVKIAEMQQHKDIVNFAFSPSTGDGVDDSIDERRVPQKVTLFEKSEESDVYETVLLSLDDNYVPPSLSTQQRPLEEGARHLEEELTEEQPPEKVTVVEVYERHLAEEVPPKPQEQATPPPALDSREHQESAVTRSRSGSLQVEAEYEEDEIGIDTRKVNSLPPRRKDYSQASSTQPNPLEGFRVSPAATPVPHQLFVESEDEASSFPLVGTPVSLRQQVSHTETEPEEPNEEVTEDDSVVDEWESVEDFEHQSLIRGFLARERSMTVEEYEDSDYDTDYEDEDEVANQWMGEHYPDPTISLPFSSLPTQAQQDPVQASIRHVRAATEKAAQKWVQNDPEKSLHSLRAANSPSLEQPDELPLELAVGTAEYDEVMLERLETLVKTQHLEIPEEVQEALEAGMACTDFNELVNTKQVDYLVAVREFSDKRTLSPVERRWIRYGYQMLLTRMFYLYTLSADNLLQEDGMKRKGGKLTVATNVAAIANYRGVSMTLAKGEGNGDETSIINNYIKQAVSELAKRDKVRFVSKEVKQQMEEAGKTQGLTLVADMDEVSWGTKFFRDTMNFEKFSIRVKKQDLKGAEKVNTALKRELAGVRVLSNSAAEIDTDQTGQKTKEDYRHEIERLEQRIKSSDAAIEELEKEIREIQEKIENSDAWDVDILARHVYVEGLKLRELALQRQLPVVIQRTQRAKNRAKFKDPALVLASKQKDIAYTAKRATETYKKKLKKDDPNITDEILATKGDAFYLAKVAEINHRYENIYLETLYKNRGAVVLDYPCFKEMSDERRANFRDHMINQSIDLPEHHKHVIAEAAKRAGVITQDQCSLERLKSDLVSFEQPYKKAVMVEIAKEDPEAFTVILTTLDSERFEQRAQMLAQKAQMLAQKAQRAEETEGAEQVEEKELQQSWLSALFSGCQVLLRGTEVYDPAEPTKVLGYQSPLMAYENIKKACQRTQDKDCDYLTVPHDNGLAIFGTDVDEELLLAAEGNFFQYIKTLARNDKTEAITKGPGKGRGNEFLEIKATQYKVFDAANPVHQQLASLSFLCTLLSAVRGGGGIYQDEGFIEKLAALNKETGPLIHMYLDIGCELLRETQPELAHGDVWLSQVFAHDGIPGKGVVNNDTFQPRGGWALLRAADGAHIPLYYKGQPQNR